MSASSAPFGLRPAFFPTGLERAQALTNGITSGYASNILKNQPVVYGSTANGGTLGTIIPAAATGAITGANVTGTVISSVAFVSITSGFILNYSSKEKLQILFK